jgi:hypothetical protein
MSGKPYCASVAGLRWTSVKFCMASEKVIECGFKFSADAAYAA